MIQQYIFLTTLMLLWILCLTGSLLNWKWLIDPPEELRWCYSQSSLKYYFGSDFTKAATIAFSSLGILCTAWFILFLIGNNKLIIAYYTIILITVCIYGFILIKKKIKQFIINKTPIPDYLISEDGHIICNKCGYKQPANTSCMNCGKKFNIDKKAEI